MGFTVDIDTGGTFTDGLFTDGTEIKRVKVDTTPHDITVSWLDTMREGARAFGFSTLREFLEQVVIVRWSNTTATNIIAEKKGPKIGLFVTGGFQESLYSSDKKSEVFGHLVDETNVEAVTYPLDSPTLVLQLKRLLEKGVRRICISLKDGLRNLDEEIQIKQAFEEQYPDHYLGNVPFLLAGDICRHPDDMTRTHVALLNSYVHGPMARAMFKAEDDLRERGYPGALLVGHTDGGVAKVSKTKPVDTIESGPIFGIHAGVFWAEKYQLPNVITLDVGGTTTKIGLVENFRPVMTRKADILGVPLRQTMLDLRSIALGGGTVASVSDGELKLGPQSMGAYPGPACYDLGGGEPTLTDAYLAAGFLDPDYFAGGSKKIKLDRAIEIISEKIAGPLGVEAQVAAYQIANLATRMIADEVSKLIRRSGKSPGDYTLFAFGGNGAIVGSGVARKTEIEKAYVFSLGAVLSAFGSSVADVSHTYDYSPYLPVSDNSSLVKIIRRMMEDAKRDMEGEGFDPEKVESELEITLDQKDDLTQLICPWTMEDLGDEGLMEMLERGLEKGGVEQGKSQRVIEVLKFRVKSVVSKVDLSETPLGGNDPSLAEKGERDVFRGKEKVLANLFDWDRLTHGNVIEGPALIEGRDATYVVPRTWYLTIDSFQNGVLQRR